MDKLVFATNNTHKLEEIQLALKDIFNIQSLKELGCNTDIPETGNSLVENALIKARFIHQEYHCDCFADDTGLEITALNGEPGVYSARYAGEQKNSEDNMDLVLQKLQGVKDRSAQFKTVIALILDGKEYLFEGIVEGQILPTRSGEKGFGYDPIFQPKGFDRSFAQMSTEEKNQISHRGKAVAQLITFLIKT